jgi:hypothetical protein
MNTQEKRLSIKARVIKKFVKPLYDLFLIRLGNSANSLMETVPPSPDSIEE